MATILQSRRGTTAEHSTFTGAVGEVTVDTDKDVVIVHDGTTAGGFPTVKEGHTQAASTVVNTPAGDIAATDVQAAINELDTEKAPLASPALTGNPTAPTPATNDSDTSIATTAFVNVGYVDQDSDLGAANLPTGTTAQRPGTPAEGMFRRNTTTGEFEGFNGTVWGSIAGTPASASETVEGIAELATQAETDTGTDDLRIITPLKLNNSPQTASTWVNFNGTGTVAIRSQFNVSSITDGGVGKYTVNFTVALTDTNYAVVVGSGTNGVAVKSSYTDGNHTSSHSTSNVAIAIAGADGVSNLDDDNVAVTIYGN